MCKHIAFKQIRTNVDDKAATHTCVFETDVPNTHIKELCKYLGGTHTPQIIRSNGQVSTRKLVVDESHLLPSVTVGPGYCCRPTRCLGLMEGAISSG